MTFFALRDKTDSFKHIFQNGSLKIAVLKIMETEIAVIKFCIDIQAAHRMNPIVHTFMSHTG